MFATGGTDVLTTTVTLPLGVHPITLAALDARGFLSVSRGRLEVQLPAGVPGPQGPAGVNGTNGTNGKDGVSILGVPEPAGANCANGGEKLTPMFSD